MMRELKLTESLKPWEGILVWSVGVALFGLAARIYWLALASGVVLALASLYRLFNKPCPAQEPSVPAVAIAAADKTQGEDKAFVKMFGGTCGGLLLLALLIPPAAPLVGLMIAFVALLGFRTVQVITVVWGIAFFVWLIASGVLE